MIQHVEWLASEYGFRMLPSVRAAWEETQSVIESVATETSDVRVFVQKLAQIPQPINSNCIDVHEAFPLHGGSPLYDQKVVTGANLCVQANLVTQAATARAIEEAVNRLESQMSESTRKIVFACLGGTHRSFGCACLLSALAYPRAGIVPSSERTIRDARAHLVKL